MSITVYEYPKCPACQSQMLPIEDVANTAAFLKGWICSKRECGNNIMFKAGTLLRMKIVNEQVEQLR